MTNPDPALTEYEAELERARKEMTGDTEQQAPGLDWDAASRKMIEQARGTPEPYWMIWYEDYDRRPELFTIEMAARVRYQAALTNWSCHLFCSADQLAAAQAHSRLLDDQLRRTQGYAADMAGEVAALKQRIACRFSHDEVDGLIAKATAALKQRLEQCITSLRSEGWHRAADFVDSAIAAKVLHKADCMYMFDGTSCSCGALVAEPPVRKCICEVPPQGLPRMADPDCPLHGDPAIIGEPPGGQQEQGQ